MTHCFFLLSDFQGNSAKHSFTLFHTAKRERLPSHLKSNFFLFSLAITHELQTTRSLSCKTNDGRNHFVARKYVGDNKSVAATGRKKNGIRHYTCMFIHSGISSSQSLKLVRVFVGGCPAPVFLSCHNNPQRSISLSFYLIYRTFLGAFFPV